MRPAVGSAEPGDQAQRRALAAARGAEQAQELVLADRKLEVLERDRAGGEGLADALEPDQLGTRRGSPAPPERPRQREAEQREQSAADHEEQHRIGRAVLQGADRLADQGGDEHLQEAGQPGGGAGEHAGRR